MRWRRLVASRPQARADEGQVLVLTIGLVVLAMLLVTVVGSAAGVHLERKRLVALADELALEGADAVADDVYFDPDRAPSRSDPTRPNLTDASVHAAVAQYLRDNRETTDRWRDLAWSADASTDGRTAQVQVEALVRPPLLSWVLEPWSDGIRVRATSQARAG